MVSDSVRALITNKSHGTGHSRLGNYRLKPPGFCGLRDAGGKVLIEPGGRTVWTDRNDGGPTQGWLTSRTPL